MCSGKVWGSGFVAHVTDKSSDGTIVIFKKGAMPANKEKGEEVFLLESSRHVTKMASALFYGNGLIVSALPLCKYLVRAVDRRF